jgi:hypothetical protein
MLPKSSNSSWMPWKDARNIAEFGGKNDSAKLVEFF